MTISAVIPTWNRADLLRSVLANLRSQTRTAEQIVVIDNGSRDESCDIARQYGVDLIAFPENRGFAIAVNEGIMRARGDWILILNNDVVLQPDWLETVAASAERE